MCFDKTLSSVPEIGDELKLLMKKIEDCEGKVVEDVATVRIERTTSQLAVLATDLPGLTSNKEGENALTRKKILAVNKKVGCLFFTFALFFFFCY